jgi:hypothetical protein
MLKLSKKLAGLVTKTYEQVVDNFAQYFTSRLRHAHVIHMLDKVCMLSSQSLSKAHREPPKRIARGVLLAFGIALCFPTEAGSTKPKEYIDYKTYSLYLLDFNYQQHKCLLKLYGKESAWKPDAVNGSHYGIPQGKSVYLSTLNGYDQIQWGLNYIGHRYGEPCVAWDHWKRKRWH